MSTTQAPLAARWLKATPSLRENALRVAYLRSELERHPVGELALALKLALDLKQRQKAQQALAATPLEVAQRLRLLHKTATFFAPNLEGR